jgi:hypothetical protein
MVFVMHLQTAADDCAALHAPVRNLAGVPVLADRQMMNPRDDDHSPDDQKPWMGCDEQQSQMDALGVVILKQQTQ